MSISPEQFLALPPEIQTEIISKDPALLQSFSKANKRYQQQLQRSYLETICNTPLTQTELDNYLGETPLILGVVVNSNNLEFVSMRIYINNLNSLRYKVYERYMELDENLNLVTDNFNSSDSISMANLFSGTYDELTPDDILDFVTLHRIYSKRLSCLNIDPKFATNKVVAELDQIYRSYNKADQSSLLSTILILAMNSIILNVYPKFDLNLILSFKQQSIVIDTEINRLYRDIRKKLLCL